MRRAALALVLVAFACVASSEPRIRSSAPAPAPPVTVPAPATTNASEPSTMDAPAPDQPTSPRTIYPVLEIKPDGEGARVTIGIGKKHGVNTSWKAHLVDEDGRPVRGGELTIRSVEQAMTRATTKLSIDTVPKGVQAHLRPS